MFSKLVQYLFLLRSFALSQQQVNFTTIPNTDSGPVYLIPKEGTLNVSLYCKVILNNFQIQTRWLVKRPMDSLPITTDYNAAGELISPPFLMGKIRAIGDVIPDLESNLTYETNFTILNFTSEFDVIQIKCGPQGVLREFNLGFPVSPTLLILNNTLLVIENSNITVNLTVEETPTPFPPILTSQWIHEGQLLLFNSNNIILTDYTITLDSVQRNQSGNYTLTVSNDAGSTTTSFLLDVLYAPFATSIGGSQLVLSGSTVTLIAFTDIEGNPVPNDTWTGPDALPVSTVDDHYNISVDGQITITNVTNTDNGTYKCTISNGIGIGYSQTVQLMVAVLPGSPLNVKKIDVTDTTVTLTWLPPTELGTPAASYYHVVMEPSPPSDVIVNATNNTLIIRGIIPGTTYNVTVVAIAIGDTIGLVEGQPSLPISFTTLKGAPEFQSVNVLASNGNIDISWMFRHTGGQDIDDIDVYCAIDGENRSNHLSDMLSCSDITRCVDDSLMGNISVGPVFAGERYFCSVTAINTNGTDVKNISNIISIKGKPSFPELVSTITSPGQVTLIARTRSSGDNATFQFNVTIINITDNSIIETETFPFMNYVSNTTVYLTIELPNGGSFVFIVITTNKYGTGKVAMTTGTIIIQPISTTPITTSTPTIRHNVLSVGVIAGITIGVIILLILMIVIIIVIVISLYKVSSTKQSRGETSPVIKEFFSVKNEAYGISKRPDHQSSIDVTENVAYSTLEQQSSLVNPPVYQTINEDSHKTTNVYDNINEYI